MSLAISVKGLVHRYPPDVKAVNGLDLEVTMGECFGLLGPNGAGKTTTIEILEGLLEPTGGDVELLGRRWKTDATELRGRIGITLQLTNLPDKLTIQEILELFRSFHPKGRNIDDVIKLVSLEEKRGAWFDKLSGGQKQRVAVACALVGDPELLFLDEPTTGLDPQSRRQLWDIVTQMKAAGRTVLLTTHYMDEAERLCDRIAIVDHGKIIALGTPRELIRKYVGEEVIEITTNAPLIEGDLRSVVGITNVHAAGEGWKLSTTNLAESVPSLIARLNALTVKIDQLSTHRASLEDVFVELTGRKLRD